MKAMRLAVLSVLVTASFAMPASAQQTGRLAERFRQLDRNDDGKLTPTEARQAAIFKTVDANSDGFVTIEELREYYARRGRAAKRASTASALEPAPRRRLPSMAGRHSNRCPIPMRYAMRLGVVNCSRASTLPASPTFVKAVTALPSSI